MANMVADVPEKGLENNKTIIMTIYLTNTAKPYIADSFPTEASDAFALKHEI